MKLKIELNPNKIVAKVDNPRFGKFVSNEWKRLIDPYTPKNTGLLMEDVEILPYKIHYKVPYANAVYHMRGAEFKKNNPYSTYEWDKAAEKAGQKNKLYVIANAALISGRFNI
jgi:hypothetical protein